VFTHFTKQCLMTGNFEDPVPTTNLPSAMFYQAGQTRPTKQPGKKYLGLFPEPEI